MSEWDNEAGDEEECESGRDVFWVCQAFTGLYLRPSKEGRSVCWTSREAKMNESAGWDLLVHSVTMIAFAHACSWNTPDGADTLAQYTKIRNTSNANAKQQPISR